MALIINTNLSSINGQRNLSSSATALTTSMTRLSSGVRVNNAKDDAAGPVSYTHLTLPTIYSV